MYIFWRTFACHHLIVMVIIKLMQWNFFLYKKMEQIGPDVESRRQFFFIVRNASVSTYEPTPHHRLEGSRQTALVRVVRNGPMGIVGALVEPSSPVIPQVVQLERVRESWTTRGYYVYR
jgi:hypothetical protein